MTDLEINQICHRVITGGKGCWHTPRGITNLCKYCGFFFSDGDNPDYLNNKSDAYDLIHFIMNDWSDEDFYNFTCSVPRHLLVNRRALPTAVALYEKEKGE